MEDLSYKGIWAVKSDGKHHRILYAKRLPRKTKKMATSILQHNTEVVITSANFMKLSEHLVDKLKKKYGIDPC